MSRPAWLVTLFFPQPPDVGAGMRLWLTLVGACHSALVLRTGDFRTICCGQAFIRAVIHFKRHPGQLRVCGLLWWANSPKLGKPSDLGEGEETLACETPRLAERFDGALLFSNLAIWRSMQLPFRS